MAEHYSPTEKPPTGLVNPARRRRKELAGRAERVVEHREIGGGDCEPDPQSSSDRLADGIHELIQLQKEQLLLQKQQGIKLDLFVKGQMILQKQMKAQLILQAQQGKNLDLIMERLKIAPQGTTIAQHDAPRAVFGAEVPENSYQIFGKSSAHHDAPRAAVGPEVPADRYPVFAADLETEDEQDSGFEENFVDSWR